MRPLHYNSRFKNDLSPREREVLDLIARGRTNGEIAALLNISFDTAKSHVSHILAKLEVDSREDAASTWQYHHSTGARLGRLVRAIFPFAGTRITVGVTAVVAVAVAGVIAIALTRGGEDPATGSNNPAEPNVAVQQPLASDPAGIVGASFRGKADLVSGAYHFRTDGKWDLTVGSETYYEGAYTVEGDLLHFIETLGSNDLCDPAANTFTYRFAVVDNVLTMENVDDPCKFRASDMTHLARARRE